MIESQQRALGRFSMLTTGTNDSQNCTALFNSYIFSIVPYLNQSVKWPKRSGFRPSKREVGVQITATVKIPSAPSFPPSPPRCFFFPFLKFFFSVHDAKIYQGKYSEDDYFLFLFSALGIKRFVIQALAQ